MKSINKILLALAILLPPQAFSGAWDYGSFDNDSAADWVYELDQSKTTRYLLTVFNAVPSSGYIDVDVCSVAIAAAEVTASLKDGKTQNLPKSVANWVQVNKPDYKVALAARATEILGYCKDTKRSELAQLWDEGDSVKWFSNISVLGARLQ
ncbi:DUF4259 domain-containing protein [Neptuniibacter sp. SY11_33]|uniref:DUF4259 domain-containing protein n=1 Tax=Neptuniibacter sp. SY11_33 TaxID=3398215 RepID=UPI0039F5D778